MIEVWPCFAETSGPHLAKQEPRVTDSRSPNWSTSMRGGRSRMSCAEWRLRSAVHREGKALPTQLQLPENYDSAAALIYSKSKG